MTEDRSMEIETQKHRDGNGCLGPFGLLLTKYFGLGHLQTELYDGSQFWSLGSPIPKHQQIQHLVRAHSMLQRRCRSLCPHRTEVNSCWGLF